MTVAVKRAKPAGSAAALAYAFGEPRIYGSIRTKVEDFRVDEIPSVVPDNEGDHLLLRIRKTSANTDWAAARLAEALGVARRDVSYAGRKDRHAITSQWFSARLPGAEPRDWQGRLPGCLQVLASHRHRRKLRRGALAGNRFEIVVRQLNGEIESLSERVAHVRAEGVPNYFGSQRFGRDGGNVAAAEDLFLGKTGKLRRNRREMLISAARSYIFNEVLARRVADASWNTLMVGDVAGLAGSHSVFPVKELDDSLRERAMLHDIHPTGPLWGRGELMSRGEVAALESGIAHRNEALARGLERAGLAHARRPLRLSVPGIEAEVQGDTATLRFQLDPGCYATVVLRELLIFDEAGIGASGAETEQAND